MIRFGMSWQNWCRKIYCFHFKVVKAFDSSACGRASGTGASVIITDITNDIAFIPHKRIVESAGFRAVK